MVESWDGMVASEEVGPTLPPTNPVERAALEERRATELGVEADDGAAVPSLIEERVLVARVAWVGVPMLDEGSLLPPASSRRILKLFPVSLDVV